MLYVFAAVSKSTSLAFFLLLSWVLASCDEWKLSACCARGADASIIQSPAQSTLLQIPYVTARVLVVPIFFARTRLDYKAPVGPLASTRDCKKMPVRSLLLLSLTAWRTDFLDTYTRQGASRHGHGSQNELVVYCNCWPILVCGQGDEPQIPRSAYCGKACIKAEWKHDNGFALAPHTFSTSLQRDFTSRLTLDPFCTFRHLLSNTLATWRSQNLPKSQPPSRLYELPAHRGERMRELAFSIHFVLEFRMLFLSNLRRDHDWRPYGINSQTPHGMVMFTLSSAG